MGVFDFLSKPRGYSAWKMQMGYTAGIINNHVEMLEALEQVIRNADLGVAYYKLSVIDHSDSAAGEGFFLDCKISDHSENENVLRGVSYMGTKDEYLAKVTIWLGLSDSQINMMEAAQYSIDDDDQIVIQYVMKLPYAVMEEDYVIRAFAEKIHQRLPNNDVTAGVNGILVSVGGSGKLEFSRHLKS